MSDSEISLSANSRLSAKNWQDLYKIDLIAPANFFKDGVSLMYHSIGKCRPQVKSEVYKTEFDDAGLVNTDLTEYRTG